jgi:hypothetical protein
MSLQLSLKFLWLIKNISYVCSFVAADSKLKDSIPKKKNLEGQNDFIFRNDVTSEATTSSKLSGLLLKKIGK